MLEEAKKSGPRVKGKKSVRLKRFNGQIKNVKQKKFNLLLVLTTSEKLLLSGPLFLLYFSLSLTHTEHFSIEKSNLKPKSNI